MAELHDYTTLVEELIALAVERAEAFDAYTRKPHSTTHTDDWITGASRDSMAALRHDAQSRASALAGHRSQPYFCRIATASDADTDEWLFSKARFPGLLFVDGIDGSVLSWTSPLYARLRGVRAREQVCLSGRHGPTTHTVISASDWGRLLPTPADILIREATHDIVVRSPGDTVGLDTLVVLPAGAGETALQASSSTGVATAKPAFGLSEIIALADATQRDAMHLPFADSVLIQGPPGSGKTSVGLMRIACLIDRQWTELNLSPSAPAFHDFGTSRVLVMNPEMVPYLATLMADIELPRVPVLTLPEFAHEVCRQSTIRSLTGTPTHASAAVDQFKLSTAGVIAFWRAVQRRLGEWWQVHGDHIHQQFLAIHAGMGHELGRIIDSWITHVRTWDPLGSDAPDRVRLASRLNRWASTRLSEAAPIAQSEIRSPRDEAANAARLLQRNAIPQLCSQVRRHITDALSRHSILECLKPDDTIGPDDVAQWVASSRDAGTSKPVYSMADCALHGWLTALFTLADLPPHGRLHFGAPRERVTHVVIDEAQDVSIAHVLLVTALLAPGGTITLVGDLRQRLDGQGAFADWADLPIRNLAQAMFSVNHRQTQPVGEFVAGLHLSLYSEEAGWSPSSRIGPAVRSRTEHSGLLESALLEEVSHWLTCFPSSLVGVLFVDPPTREDASRLQVALEAGLSDHLVTVDVASTESSDRQFRRHSGVVLAPVALTKGLEFEAVVTIAPAALQSPAQRNRLYVGASRARQGLTVIRMT